MNSDTKRREFVRALLGGVAGLTITLPAFAQGRGGGAPAPITATKLTERIVAFSGAGGNVGLIIGPDGLLMIDGGTTNRAPDLARAIAEASPRPVQVLFNTHFHGDHVGSNELLRRNYPALRVIAHENVKTRLSTRWFDARRDQEFTPLPAAALPSETFTTGGRLDFGGEALQYTHTPRAHTDGDAFVFLPRSNVIHTGDLFWVGGYPVVDFGVGGSLAGMAATLEQMDAVGDSRTRIICGHGPGNVDKAQMRQVREMWLAINGRLEDLARQGRSLEEVVAAAPTKDFDMQLGVQNPQGFLRMAYNGVLGMQ